MGTFFLRHMVIFHSNMTMHHHQKTRPEHTIRSPPFPAEEKLASRRWAVLSTFLAASTAVGAQREPLAVAESWGTHSFIKEKYFQPDISPEDAAARIRQTAEGLRAMRHMLDTMSWRYVLFYVRLKMAYLSSDMKNAMASLPESRRKSYVKTANEVVDNMTELDRYVRTPKVYESYLYYEKTLKSLDDLVALLA